MKLWGKVGQTARGWHVRGLWQGKRIQLSQIPTGSGFIPCTSKDLAQWLQIEISKEIHAERFNPARYRKAKPLHVAAYAEKWLEMKKPNVAYKTYKGYQVYNKLYISHGIGSEYLPDLTHEKIQLWLNGIDKSVAYKKKIYACLRGMLTDAKRSGYISQLPEPIKFDMPVKQIEWLDKETQEKILSKIPPAHRFIIRFIMYTGVRPSEARALQRADIKEDRIIIRNTFGPVKGGEALKPVKSKRERVIHLYRTVRDLLKSMPPTLSPFVFVNPATKKPYSKNINRDVWNPACKAALGYLFPLNNAGRHSFANQLLEQGADFENVSAALGHRDTSTTKASYARPNLKVIGGMVDRIQND